MAIGGKGLSAEFGTINTNTKYNPAMMAKAIRIKLNTSSALDLRLAVPATPCSSAIGCSLNMNAGAKGQLLPDKNFDVSGSAQACQPIIHRLLLQLQDLIR